MGAPRHQAGQRAPERRRRASADGLWLRQGGPPHHQIAHRGPCARRRRSHPAVPHLYPLHPARHDAHRRLMSPRPCARRHRRCCCRKRRRRIARCRTARPSSSTCRATPPSTSEPTSSVWAPPSMRWDITTHPLKSPSRYGARRAHAATPPPCRAAAERTHTCARLAARRVLRRDRTRQTTGPAKRPDPPLLVVCVCVWTGQQAHRRRVLALARHRRAAVPDRQILFRRFH
jgi:hypothetical protein